MPRTFHTTKDSYSDSARPAATAGGRRSRWSGRLGLLLAVASVGYFVVVSMIAAAPYLLEEEWWPYTVFCYFPRAPLLLPPMGLALVNALRRQWRDVLFNSLSASVVVGPLMGLNIGRLASADRDAVPSRVRVLTSNIQGGESRLYSLLLEIRRARPDVILLQEVTPKSLDLLEKELSDWRGVSSGEFWVAAHERPVLIAECHTTPFRRKTAVACRVAVDGDPMTVVAVHLTTVRWGLEKLLGQGEPSPSGQSGVEVFKHHEALRDQEASQTRAWLKTLDDPSPVLGGDFNTTPQCRLYTAHWASLKNAFSEVGSGFGYTARCDDPAYWPANTPWVRIDHLLYGPDWECLSVGRGQTNGSDHRLIWGDFVRGASSR